MGEKAREGLPEVSGIIPALPTPFTQDGALDLEQIQQNLMRHNQSPLSGYVIGGSNGEFVFLQENEKVQVVESARSVIPEDRTFIVGTGLESTQATMRLTSLMAAGGAQVAIVVTPSYFTNQMTSAALVAHYRQVADASPIPILLYNVPANTGINLPIDAIAQLALHANIIGIKDSGGDIARIGAIIERTPADFSVLAGSGGFLLAALAVGAVGCISALANIAGIELSNMLGFFRSGALDEARALQLKLLDINKTVTLRYGVAGLKVALDRIGFYGGPVRAPLLPLSDDEKEAVRESLEKAGLLAAAHT